MTASIRSKNPALKREIRAARRAQDPRQLHPAGDPVRAPGLHRDRIPRSMTPTGIRKPIAPSRARTPTTRCASPTTSSTPSRRRRLEPDCAQNGKVREDPEGARAVGEDRLRRLGLRRSRHPVPHHHQRLAHLPGFRPRSAPPIRARNTCSSTTRPAISPRSICWRSAARTAASTSKPSSMRCGCGRSCSRSR